MKLLNRTIMSFFIILDVYMLFNHQVFNNFVKQTADVAMTMQGWQVLLATAVIGVIVFFLPTFMYTMSTVVNNEYNLMSRAIADEYQPNPDDLEDAFYEKGFTKIHGSFWLVLFMCVPIGLFIYSVARHLKNLDVFGFSLAHTSIYAMIFITVLYYVSSCYGSDPSLMNCLITISFTALTMIILASTSMVIAVYTLVLGVLRLGGTFVGKQYVERHKPTFTAEEKEALRATDGTGKQSQVTRIAKSIGQKNGHQVFRMFSLAFKMYVSFEFMFTLILGFITGQYILLLLTTIVLVIAETIRYLKFNKK